MARQPLHATLHKGDFIPMCERAQEKGISQKDIKAAWEKCGIHPFNRQRVLTNPHLHLTETPNPHRRVGLRNLPGQRPAPASEIQMLAAAEPSTLEEAKLLLKEIGSKAQEVEASLAIAKEELHLSLTREKPARTSRKKLSTARYATRGQLEEARHAWLEQE
jgi:hypothetical protein